MSNAEKAEEFKALGNAAQTSKDYHLAVTHYTSAIDLNGSNHVYYSNRSAAYLCSKQLEKALEDGNACIGLKPDFAKGYSRKGAALHAMKRYNDSIAAYEMGLGKFPEDKGLVSGMADVKKEKDLPYGARSNNSSSSSSGGSNPIGQMFGPDMMTKIAADPKLKTYLSDASFVAKLNELQNDPNNIQSAMSDPRIMEVLQMLLGGMGGGGDDDESTSVPAPKVAKKDAPPAPKVEKVEDVSWMTPEELKVHTLKRANEKEAVVKKNEGNALYGAKQFPEALAKYDEACALDPTNMTFHSNKAAVYFAQKAFDECIASCEAAVEVGKVNKASYEDRAKAYTRAGKAYHKKGDITNAVEFMKKAQVESFQKDTERLLKTWELDAKKAAFVAYQSVELGEEAKTRGNDLFRNQEFGKSVLEYEDAVKRNPTNAPIRNNLAAALCKVMDFNGAKTHIDKALDLDKGYVKAWARKGDIHVLMKENHKALDSYKKGLELDPTNKTCSEGLAKVTNMINMGARNMSEDEKKERAEHGMADPEIQMILQDPIIRQVLRDFNEQPDAAQTAMRDKNVKAKIEKLIAAGVLQTA